MKEGTCVLDFIEWTDHYPKGIKQNISLFMTCPVAYTSSMKTRNRIITTNLSENNTLVLNLDINSEIS